MSGAAGSCRRRPSPSRSSRTRCCRAHTGCPGVAQALLAIRCGRRLGGDLAAASRRARAAVRPGARRALRAARQELGLRAGTGRALTMADRAAGDDHGRATRSAAEAADVVAEAVDHEEQQQHDADRAVALHRGQRDALPRTFSASDQSTWPPSSGRNGNRLITASTSETKPRKTSAIAGAGDDRFVRVLR